MKSLFISLLALQPAASALLSAARRPAPAFSAKTIGAHRAVEIVGDGAASAASTGTFDLHDLTGHHRYYGQSACP